MTEGVVLHASALVEALQHESDQGVRAAILDTLKGSKDPSIARAMVKLIEANLPRALGESELMTYSEFITWRANFLKMKGPLHSARYEADRSMAATTALTMPLYDA